MHFPLAHYPGFSRFVLDWLGGDTRFLPRGGEARPRRARNRDELAQALIESNRRWGLFVGDDMQRWNRGESVAVIAGQQTGFAGLVSFFTSFGYFATEEENVAVVHEMGRVLEKGAVFLFDYLNVHRELEKLVQRETRPAPAGDVLIERWFDPSDRSFNKRITIGQKRYLERVRGYDLDEISMMFTTAGLTIRAAYGDFLGAKFEMDSPRLILVGTKNR